MIKEQVIQAYNFAQKKHHGQVRKFVNLPYFTHPKFVARVIEELTDNPHLVCVALLHDVLEDTDATPAEIFEKLGSLSLVENIKELTNDKTEMKKVGKTQYLSEKMLKMSSDCLTVKLADRYHNVLFLENDKIPESFVRKYSLETNEILKSLIAKRDPINRIQRALILRIVSVLIFLQIKFKLEIDVPQISL